MNGYQQRAWTCPALENLGGKRVVKVIMDTAVKKAGHLTHVLVKGLNSGTAQSN